MKSLPVWLLLATVGAGCSRETPTASSPLPFRAGQLVDLSHAYDAQSIFWPTAEQFRLQKDADGITPAGFYYSSNSFFTSEHGG
ncbi:MAG TPA: hypothetical protein VM819_06350, partial [Vicinamibacterales bacterium]|nr:hypothetical protein [Vicinamibacterales bacterium]